MKRLKNQQGYVLAVVMVVFTVLGILTGVCYSTAVWNYQREEDSLIRSTNLYEEEGKIEKIIDTLMKKQKQTYDDKKALLDDLGYVAVEKENDIYSIDCSNTNIHATVQIYISEITVDTSDSPKYKIAEIKYETYEVHM